MRIRSVLAGVVAGVVLAGCGGEPEPVTPAAAPADAVTAPAAAAAAPEQAAAEGPATDAGRAASAINLVAGDLPGYADGGVPTLTPAKELALERAETCLQSPPRTLRVAHVPSSMFRNAATQLTAGSEVHVMADPQTAGKEQATLDHPDVDACLGSLLGEVLALDSGGTVTVTRTSTELLEVTPAHGVAARGRRVEARVNAPGAELDVWMDIVALQHRSTVTSMSLISTGEPPSGAERTRLVQLLSQRMAKAAI